MGLRRGSPIRGYLTLPRMNAHRLVIVAAALTTVVAAALGAALATFSGLALPRAIRHDLGTAAGTPLVINGPVNAGQAAQYDSILPARISSDGWPWPRRPPPRSSPAWRRYPSRWPAATGPA